MKIIAINKGFSVFKMNIFGTNIVSGTELPFSATVNTIRLVWISHNPVAIRIQCKKYRYNKMCAPIISLEIYALKTIFRMCTIFILLPAYSMYVLESGREIISRLGFSELIFVTNFT